MVAPGGAGSATPDQVADDELLTRLFEARHFQDGTIHYSHFRSNELSVFRELYAPWQHLLAGAATGIGAAQFTAGYARAAGLDVIKAEPPPAHAHVVRGDGQRISIGTAKKLRDEAMRRIVAYPPGLP